MGSSSNSGVGRQRWQWQCMAHRHAPQPSRQQQRQGGRQSAQQDPCQRPPVRPWAADAHHPRNRAAKQASVWGTAARRGQSSQDSCCVQPGEEQRLVLHHLAQVGGTVDQECSVVTWCCVPLTAFGIAYMQRSMPVHILVCTQCVHICAPPLRCNSVQGQQSAGYPATGPAGAGGSNSSSSRPAAAPGGSS